MSTGIPTKVRTASSLVAIQTEPSRFLIGRYACSRREHRSMLSRLTDVSEKGIKS